MCIILKYGTQTMENTHYKSILDVTLDKETFENVIGIGMKQFEVLRYFGVTGKEMDEWCGKEYGIPQFTLIYERVRQIALADYYELLRKLGVRGNTSALNIIDNIVRGAMAEQQTVKIVFDSGSMRKETEQEKLND